MIAPKKREAQQAEKVFDRQRDEIESAVAVATDRATSVEQCLSAERSQTEALNRRLADATANLAAARAELHAERQAKYAAVALSAYADAAAVDAPEYAQQVRELVSRAGPFSRLCKVPD